MLMQLGEFQFSVSTLAYDSVSRTAKARFARHEIAGGGEKLHAVGVQADSIRLSGTFYPQLAATLGGPVGTESLDNLRATLKNMQPQLLVAGDGEDLGFWVIEELETVGSLFSNGAGVPRRQQFNIRLAFYDGR